MCEYDSYAVNSNQYNDDLGIYDLTKSSDGWCIVHCVIPSSGLEIRILFWYADFRAIYLCRQYYSKSISSPDDDNNILKLGTDREESYLIEETQMYSSDSNALERYNAYAADTENEDNEDNEDNVNNMDLYGTKTVGFMLETDASAVDRPHYGSSQTTSTKLSVRAWTKWEIPKIVKTAFMNQEVRSKAVDSGLKQMMMSVQLDMRNTNAFCTDSWNILDAIVVACSLGSLVVNGIFLSTFRALRIFRVIIRHAPMRSILSSLGKGMPSIMSAIAFSAIVFFILAVIGLNLFFGKLDTYVFFLIL